MPGTPIAALILFLTLLAGCAETRPVSRPADADARIVEIQTDLALDPESPALLREIGVLYMQTNRPVEAEPFLSQAYDQGDRHPELVFYKGLSTELLNDFKEAIPYYAQYVDVPRTSRYRRYMQGRYDWLTRQVVREEMIQYVQPEQDLVPGDAPAATIAVYSLYFQGATPQFQPLGRGLAELISIDLAQLSQLTIVERVRMQALLDEMRLGPYLDPATAPRVGRILRAGRIVSGAYDVLGDNSLRVDLGAWQYDLDDEPAYQSSTDNIDNLFRFQKTLVYDLVGGLGITLTPEERERIEFIPTQNIQAFLAFSRGLEEEDKGNYAAAANHYRQAAVIDPGFQMALDRAEAAENIDAMNGSVADVLDLVAVDVLAGAPELDLLGDRIRNLRSEPGLGIDTTTDPDSREPATESAGIQPGSGLGDPPPPPRGNNR